MTTATSQIIYDAFRQSNLVGLTVDLTTEQQAEALRYLNRIIKSVFGNEVSENLDNIPIGHQNISRPSGYPYWNPWDNNNWYVPKDVRMLLNLTHSLNMYLDPAPDDGARFAIVNISSDLVDKPVTIFGNGRLIDGQTSLVLNMNDYNQEWFYRDDIGNWMMYAPLTVTPVDMPFPFPEEFDDFFITMLAMRLNPTYGASVDQQSSAVLQRMSRQIKARYTQHRFVAPERGVRALPIVAADRTQWQYWNGGNSTSEFNSGRPRGGVY
jgi:hypothetical protein